MDSLIGQALVFIGAAVLLVPLFQRLGFGSVLGYLIAGIIVGPHALGFIQDSESVMHFSELGVVLLLFMIGLEIQPHKLWSMRRHLLGLGGLQVLLTSLVFMLFAYQMGLGWESAAIIGFGLSLSSTAFAVQTLTERNQFNTEFGRGSFAILLMQDLVAIPALAVIPFLAAKSTEAGVSWTSVAKVLGIALFLLVASRYLIRPAFRLIASTRSREIFTAATLFVVLGVAALFQAVGLSAALGTFVAGVLLADSEYRHELEADLEPFKSLLMGLFFIAVGMSVSLELIAAKPFLVFGLATGYLIVKMIVIFGVGRIFGISPENSKMMSLAIGQGGEFAFVIFGMAASLQLAPSETLKLLTAVITLSMGLCTLFALANDRLELYWQCKTPVTPNYDEIKDESPEVIIAGFGRFGQVFGRVLRAQGISFVAIDHDSEQIELVRRFGNKVYYGDASRKDLLEAAGAAKAKYFILALDDMESSLKTAQTVKENFKNLKIFARARNRGHAFDFMDLGVDHIKREVFDSSVYFVKDLLVAMGFEKEKASSLVEKFKIHDEIMLEEQFKVRNDDKMFVSVSKQAQAQLAQVLSDDNMQSRISRAPTVN